MQSSFIFSDPPNVFPTCAISLYLVISPVQSSRPGYLPWHRNPGHFPNLPSLPSGVSTLSFLASFTESPILAVVAESFIYDLLLIQEAATQLLLLRCETKWRHRFVRLLLKCVRSCLPEIDSAASKPCRAAAVSFVAAAPIRSAANREMMRLTSCKDLMLMIK